MNLEKVRLVAAREFREGIRQKTFRVTTAAMVAIVVAGIVAMRVLGSNGTVEVSLGIVGDQSKVMTPIVQQVATNLRIEIKPRALEDRPAAERALRSERVEMAVIDGKELLVKQATRGEFDRRTRLVTSLSALLAIPPTGPLPVNALEPPAPPVASPNTRAGAGVGVVFIFMFIVMYGGSLVTSVAFEKSSRLVELLLGSIRPIELMTGKVAGQGILGLLQATVVCTAALATSLAVTGSGPPLVPPRVIGATALGAILAYGVYGFAYAALGATAARSEEAGGAAVPLSIPNTIGYVLALGAFEGEDTPLIRAVSMFPLSAPYGMVARIGMGTASVAEMLISLALLLLTIAAMAMLAARIYQNSILRTGQRVKVWQAIRKAA